MIEPELLTRKAVRLGFFTHLKELLLARLSACTGHVIICHVSHSAPAKWIWPFTLCYWHGAQRGSMHRLSMNWNIRPESVQAADCLIEPGTERHIEHPLEVSNTCPCCAVQQRRPADICMKTNLTSDLHARVSRASYRCQCQSL